MPINSQRQATVPILISQKARKIGSNAIIEKAESFRGVLTVLITSLVKKIEIPTQDVRNHQAKLPNGYSGRTFDTKHITPFMKENLDGLLWLRVDG